MAYVTVLVALLTLLLPTQSWAALAWSATSTYTFETTPDATAHTFVNTANVPSGALLVLCVKNNITTGTGTFLSATGTGGDMFTMLTNQPHTTNTLYNRCAYVLAATANASYVPTMTFNLGTVEYIRAVLFVFTYTGTASFDVEVGSTEDNNDLTPASNPLTTTGTDEVCVALHADNTSQTLSGELIDGSAATRSFIGADTSAFYRILTATFTSGISNITRTNSTNIKWVQRLSCFKATAGGGAATPGNLLMMGMGS